MGMEPLNNEKVNTNLLMETNEQNFAEIYQKCVWHSVETTPNIKKSNDFANLSRRYQLKIIERNQIKSFGLKLQSLTFVDSSSVEHGINYSTLSKNIQEKLKQVPCCIFWIVRCWWRIAVIANTTTNSPVTLRCPPPDHRAYLHQPFVPVCTDCHH